MTCNKNVFIVAFVCASLWVGSLQAQQVLSLQDCLNRALEENKAIQIADYQVGVAESQQKEAEAGDKPTVDLSAGGVYFGEPLTSMLPEYGFNALLGVSQPLYTGGKIKNSKNVAQSVLDIQKQQQRQQVTAVIYDTEVAYWQVVAAKQKIKLASQYVALLDTLQHDLKRSYDAGLIYKNDVLKVQVQQYDAQLQKQRAEDGLYLAKMALSQKMGMGALASFDVDMEVTGDFEKEKEIPDIDAAVGQRTEVKMLEKSVEISQFQEKIYKADFKPTIAVSAYGIYGVGPDFNFFEQKDQLTTYVGMLNISLPILDWGQRRQKVKQQLLTTASRQTELTQTKELISIEISEAYVALNQSVLQHDMATKALSQAEENLRLTKDQLAAGTITGSDVLEAQVLWQETFTNLIDARIAYRVSSAKLRKVLNDNDI